MRDAFRMNVFAFIVKERINEELAPIMADCLTYLEMNNGVTLNNKSRASSLLFQ